MQTKPELLCNTLVGCLHFSYFCPAVFYFRNIKNLQIYKMIDL